MWAKSYGNRIKYISANGYNKIFLKGGFESL